MASIRQWSHMSATREFLLRFLDEHPDEYAQVVSGASGFEEARRFVADGPPFHPLGHCEGYDYAAGVCPGHDKP